MKLFRLTGLLIIALALFTGAAQAGPPYICRKDCSGLLFAGSCSGTVAHCCDIYSRCPPPYEFQGGNCYDNGVPICP